MEKMTTGRFYAVAMPVYAILYVIAIMAFDGQGKVAGIGAMGFALIAVLGAALFSGGSCTDGRGRTRNRSRSRT